MSRPSEVLTPDERKTLTTASNWLGAWMVTRTWLLIFALLGLAAHYPGPLTAIMVLLLLPGRQLSLAVLMHEAGHGSLFASQRLNRWVGQWLCALPTLGDMHSYASGHLEHHRKAGTVDDPDLPNYRAYPVSPASFRRKVIRDLTGQTGFKLLASLAAGGAGNMNNGLAREPHLLAKQVGVQGLLAAVLAALGWGWTWWLWFGTFMTTYMLVIRVRQVAEHAVVPDLYNPDPRANTRTVLAPAWQRFLIAPSFVNYHLEHHFMAGVPCYRLPQLRRLLQAKGYFDGVSETAGYGQVLAMALGVRPPQTA